MNLKKIFAQFLTLLNANIQLLTVFAVVAFLTGLMFSRTLLSIGMALLPIIGVASLLSDTSGVKRILKHPLTWYCWLFFGIIAFSGFYSDDLHYFFERLRIKVPFLIFPLTIPVFALLDEVNLRRVKLIFIFCLLAGIIYSLIAAMVDFTSVVEGYQFAKVLPTPVHHIRFSILVAIGAFICLEWLLKQDLQTGKFKFFSISSLIIFVFYLHLLAVRSGLLALYVGVFAMLFIYLINQKRFGLLILSAILLFCLPFVAYYTVPTFSQKFHYMRHDLKMYKEGERTVHYSDMRRIVSMEAGLNAVTERPLVGHGYGNIRLAVDNGYDLLAIPVPAENRTLPHNQYLFSWIGAGIMALFALVCLTLYPFFRKENYLLLTPIAFQLTQFISFMTEHALEVQIGTAIFLFFLFLFNREPQKWQNY